MARRMAVRSCGQALLWSCCVDLAHGIVWANHDYLLEFAGRSSQTGMPTWRAFTRGAVPGCITMRYAASRDGSVKDVACRAWTNAPSKTKSFTFLMGYTALVLEDMNKAMTTPYQESQAWRSKRLDDCSKAAKSPSVSGQIHV